MIADGDPRAEWRPSRTCQWRYRCGSVFATINEDDRGHPFRVFLTKGHDTSCKRVLLDALGRLITIAIQEGGIAPERIAHTLVGMSCGEGMVEHLSCLDDLAKMLREANKDPGEPGERGGR